MVIQRFNSEGELLAYAKKLEGMKISDIATLVGRLDEVHRKYTKGVVAHIIETEYFGIPTNSSEYPDFKKLNIELKVSPLKTVQRYHLVNAKERNVIGMVDYEDVLNNASWHDNKRLSGKLGRVLFVFYLHEKTKLAMDWKVLTAFLWSPRKEEDEQIQADYTIIREKVLAGIRNSEKDNTFLATCPKHQGGYNRENPSLSKPQALCPHPVMGKAERRGFCIRNNPVTKLVAKYGLGCDVIIKGSTIGIPYFEFNVLKGGSS